MTQNQVLILSDDPESARLWALGISQQSVPAMAVTLDEDSTERLSHHAFSLILLDINYCMHKATSLCRCARAVFDGPLLLMTYMSDERFHLRAYEAGIDESISKPIGLHLMIAKTEAWLRAKSRFSVTNSTPDVLEQDLLEIDNLKLDMPHA